MPGASPTVGSTGAGSPEAACGDYGARAGSVVARLLRDPWDNCDKYHGGDEGYEEGMPGKAGYLDQRPRSSGRPPRRKPHRYTCYIDLLGASRPLHPRFDVNGPKLEAQALEQVGALLSVLDLDRHLRTRLERAWKSLSRPRPTASDERAHTLTQVVEKARDRIRRLALLFADGDIDREGYELGRSKAREDMS